MPVDIIKIRKPASALVQCVSLVLGKHSTARSIYGVAKLNITFLMKNAYIRFLKFATFGFKEVYSN